MHEITRILAQEKSVSKNQLDTIRASGSKGIQVLIENMTNESLLETKSFGSGSIPTVSAMILADFGESKALKPMVQMFDQLDVLDVAFDEYLKCASSLAAKDIDTAINLYYDGELSPRLKSIMSDILAQTKIKDERIFRIQLKQLESGHGLSPCYLGEYGDDRAIPFLSKKLDEFECKDDIADLLDFNEIVIAIENLGGHLKPSHLKIREKFDRIRIEFRKVLEHSLRLGLGRRRQKIGRNDPCHCGSGVKYKKCCILM